MNFSAFQKCQHAKKLMVTSQRSQATISGKKSMPHIAIPNDVTLQIRVVTISCTVHSTHMIIDALCKIANHRASLSREESRTVMGELLAGKATDAQVAALLVALHMKGETVEEIVGFAEAIRAAAQPLANADGTALDVSGTEREALVDTFGTGGDARDTFQLFP